MMSAIRLIDTSLPSSRTSLAANLPRNESISWPTTTLLQGCPIGLFFLDLDRFKNINDSLGHSVGDLLLQEVAERLKKWSRELDTVARLGGDEFLITLTQVKDLVDVAVAVERLMDVMTAAFIVQ